MNPEYENAYFRAVPPTHGWPRSFGVITACNPDGKIATDDENADATNQLRLELQSAKLEHFPVTGGSKDFIHTEPGFGVVFPSQEEALAWGRRYRQEAIFWVEDDQLSLVSCICQSAKILGSWLNHQKPG
jgi:Protein of unknown function (DUF3293)